MRKTHIAFLVGKKQRRILMKTKKRDFGTLSTGQTVHLYTLKTESMAATVTDYGAILTSILLPNERNDWEDVTLGYSTLTGYTENQPFFGATIGRYANRIAGGRFVLDGKEYTLDCNDGKNHLHGGRKGFDKAVWESEAWEDRRSVNVRFYLRSPDGDQGYPGNLDVQVTFSLTFENEIRILYEAKTDAPTPLSLTNHTYFNLRGEGNGDILDHEVQLFCPRYVPVDAGLIPTGILEDVGGTPFDFAARKPVRRDIAGTGLGYDHCFVLDRENAGEGEEAPCAEVYEPSTRRTLVVRTTLPGVQFYTGNFLDGIRGKRGSVYGKHAGFCLETGHLPDSPNQKTFPDCVLRPGQVFRHSTTYSFGF